MIKNIFLNLCLLTIYSSTHTSHHQLAQPNDSQKTQIDDLYETLRLQHQTNQMLIEKLTPLVNTTPILPGTENSKKIFKEIKSQTENFTWYMTYPTGWAENRQQQKWSLTELENLIELKKADLNYLQTIFNSFSRYATQRKTTPQNTTEI